MRIHKICKRCNGIGIIKAFSLLQRNDYIYVDCSTCNGTGKIKNGKKK